MKLNGFNLLQEDLSSFKYLPELYVKDVFLIHGLRKNHQKLNVKI